ncbi:MAG TPA: hypothetical protein VGW57_00450 [Chthoniobacterales bacterium]|nr:hypothetical protein [Chthoniobacterales bacterium]
MLIKSIPTTALAEGEFQFFTFACRWTWLAVCHSPVLAATTLVEIVHERIELLQDGHGFIEEWTEFSVAPVTPCQADKGMR